LLLWLWLYLFEVEVDRHKLDVRVVHRLVYEVSWFLYCCHLRRRLFEMNNHRLIVFDEISIDLNRRESLLVEFVSTREEIDLENLSEFFRRLREMFDRLYLQKYRLVTLQYEANMNEEFVRDDLIV